MTGTPASTDNWNYAHTNFAILGMTLNKITGQPLDEVLQDMAPCN